MKYINKITEKNIKIYEYLKKDEILKPGTLVHDLILKSLAIVLKTKLIEYREFFITKFKEKHELFYLKDGSYKFVGLINKKTNFKIIC